MRKFWALLFGLTIAIALSNNSSGLSFSAIAQPAPVEFSLEPMSIDRLYALPKQVGDITAQPESITTHNDGNIVFLADANANRMRIFAFVTSVTELTLE